MDAPDRLTATTDAAVRDAISRLERAQEDDHALADLRRRLDRDGLPSLKPDQRIGAMLAADERLVAMRDVVVVERHDGAIADPPRVVRLYLTTDRLVLAGAPDQSVAIADVDELAIAGERVLIALSDGTGIRLDAGAPRVLRMLIAAVRARKRSR